jgi:hypothetical protein
VSTGTRERKSKFLTNLPPEIRNVVDWYEAGAVPATKLVLRGWESSLATWTVSQKNYSPSLQA